MCQTTQYPVGVRNPVSGGCEGIVGRPTIRWTARLHLVLAQLLRVEALEPLLKTVAVGALRVEVDGLRAVDDVLLHQDRRSRPKRQRNGIARPRINRDALAAHSEVDDGVERVVLEVAHDDAVDLPI